MRENCGRAAGVDNYFGICAPRDSDSTLNGFDCGFALADADAKGGATDSGDAFWGFNPDWGGSGRTFLLGNLIQFAESAEGIEGGDLVGRDNC